MVASMVEAFLSSSAKVLPLECQSCRTRSEEWGNLVLPRLEKEACRVETAAVVSTGSVGVSSSKARTFVVGNKRHGHDGHKEKLRAWKKRLEQRGDSPHTLSGDFHGRDGPYFLKKGANERGVFSFERALF